jgi:hypothetical protein
MVTELLSSSNMGQVPVNGQEEDEAGVPQAALFSSPSGTEPDVHVMLGNKHRNSWGDLSGPVQLCWALVFLSCNRGPSVEVGQALSLAERRYVDKWVTCLCPCFPEFSPFST